MRLFILLSVLVLSSTAQGVERPGRLGVGIMLGEPTGLSGKLFLNDHNAIDAGLSFSFIDERFQVHSDYLIHVSGVEQWSPYFGVGGDLHLRDDGDNDSTRIQNRISVRVPLGVAYQSAARSIDVFFEIVPGMSLLPETRLVVGGAIGARYYF